MSVRDWGTAGGAGVLTPVPTQDDLHRLLLDSTVGHAIIALDTAGRVLTWHGEAERLLGWTASEIVQRPVSLLYPPEAVQAGAPAAALEAAFRSGRHEAEGWRLRKDGSAVWLCTTTSPLRGGGVPAGFAVVMRDGTRQRLTEERLRHDADHDSLTGLPNRASFLARIRARFEEPRRRGDQHFAVLFMDLDRLKAVNDSLGHEAGDELIVELARRLEALLRPEDYVARLGGDEFGVLLHGIADVEEAVTITRRIQEAFGQPFPVQGREIVGSVSVGIAQRSPDHERAEDVLRDADAAMYRAKALGGGQYEVFDRAMRVQAKALARIEEAMDEALARGEFRLHYQPIVDLETGAVLACEALLRWQHPQRGLLNPAAFLPLAEELGALNAIGGWVLAEACAAAASWPAPAGSEAPAVAVNLSPRQLLHPALPEQVRSALKRSGLAPDRLQLEVSEHGLYSGGEAARGVLETLLGMGVLLSIDNFGTGASAIGQLHVLGVAALKIDRTLIARVETGRMNAVVAALVALGDTLGLRVVAEGIETVEQLKELRRLGCGVGQGMLLGPPVAQETVPALLRGRRVVDSRRQAVGALIAAAGTTAAAI
jgi:ammonium transporter, Amt family